MDSELAPAPKSVQGMAYGEGGIAIANFDEAWRMAQLFAQSDLVPKDYRDKPANCLTAMQMGAELGFKPMQALQGIAVINGRPSVWGDALWSLVQSCPAVMDAHETFDQTSMTATCIIARRGRSKPTVHTFGQTDAVKAGLWSKDGPWKHYPQRMLQMRARAFCARDAIPDFLKGMGIAEEVRDIPAGAEIDMGAVEVVRAPAAAAPAAAAPTTDEARKALPVWDQTAFEKNLPTWRKTIETGKKSAEQVIATISTRASLTDAQRQTLLAVNALPPASSSAPAASPAVAAARTGPLTNDQLTIIADKMEDAAMTDHDICKRFAVDALEKIPAAQYEAVLAFLANPMGGAA